MKIEVIDTQKEDRTENLQKKLSGKTMLERRYEQELMKVKAAADAELEDRDKGYTQIRLDMCSCMTAVSMGGRP